MSAGSRRPQAPGEPRGELLQDQLLAGAAPRLLVSLLVAGGFVWLLSRGGLPLWPPAESLALVPISAVAAFVSIQLVAMVLRTYRWVFLLRPIAPQVKPLRVMGIGLVGFTAIFVAPMRMGEIVRPYLLARDQQVSFMQAGGTLLAERVIDGVLVATFTLVALTLSPTVSPLPSSLGDLPLPLSAVPAAIYVAAAIFLGLLLAMLAFYAARERAGQLTRAVVGVVSSSAGEWAAASLARVSDGLRVLPAWRQLSSFLLATTLCWLCVISSQWLLLRGCGLPATMLQAATMVGIMGLGTVAPSGPGLFGAYQVAGFTALALFFPLDQVRTTGAAVIFVSYVAQIGLTVLQLVMGVVLMVRTPAQSSS